MAFTPIVADAQVLIDRERHANIPARVYRFFKEEKYANALAAGEVYLSTLDTCRKYEDSLQGDPGEAEHTYHCAKIEGVTANPSIIKIAQRLGIDFQHKNNEKRVVLENCTSIFRIPDAFVLCTTTVFAPEMLGETFGKYCVEISNPFLFSDVVMVELRKKIELKSSAIGHITYRERSYRELEESPGEFGFVKPLQYKDQLEYRLLYIPKSLDPIKGILLSIPALGSLCKRIA